jgi:hypothetical protein
LRAEFDDVLLLLLLLVLPDSSTSCTLQSAKLTAASAMA